MNDVFFARAQMGLSLAFHIIFASVGVAMPVLMVIADVLHLRTKKSVYRKLAKHWAKGTAVLFAVGAVSGTVLSFELGLLFPGFMRHAGALVGLPFSLEGIAFFTEAIFLGIYLYGYGRVPRVLHIASGVLVAVSGLASAVFVTMANAWMNAPLGFRVEGGALVDIDPFAAMKTPFALHEVTHMALAAYLGTAAAAAALHAVGLLRNPKSELHQRALAICLALAVPSAFAQPLVGHFAGQQVAVYQPLKLAAIEGLEKTQSHAPITVGPIEIPSGLSILAFNDPAAVVRGLDAFPRADHPPASVRIFFQIMVASGTVLAGVAGWTVLRWLRRRELAASRRYLQALVVTGPLGFIATEAGWMVTELGRQPFTIYGVLRTSDAASPMPGLVVPFATFALVYAGLGWLTVVVLRQQIAVTLRAESAKNGDGEGSQ